MSPKEQLIRFPDVDLCVFEWGKPGGQQVLLVHATGFHARCWDQVVAKLPENWHIFALLLMNLKSVLCRKPHIY